MFYRFLTSSAEFLQNMFVNTVQNMTQMTPTLWNEMLKFQLFCIELDFVFIVIQVSMDFQDLGQSRED